MHEPPARNGDSYALILIVTALSLVRGCAMLLDSRFVRCYAPSHEDIARRTAHAIAADAYPAWQVAHPGQRCPSMADLAAYTDLGALDPWGNRWDVYCQATGLLVRSAGEDGKAGTPDDIWSTDPL